LLLVSERIATMSRPVTLDRGSKIRLEGFSSFWKIFRTPSSYQLKRSPAHSKGHIELGFSSLDELPIDVLVEIFTVHLHYTQIRTLSWVCKRFRAIINKTNLWKASCLRYFPLQTDIEMTRILEIVKKDWRWLAGSISLQIPKRPNVVDRRDSIKDKIKMFCRKEPSIPKKQAIPDDVLKRIVMIGAVELDTKARILMRLLWKDKELSSRTIVVVVRCIEESEMADIQIHFELVTKLLDWMWPHMRKNIEIFMKEILEMFQRKKERQEIVEWRECARRLQKLADHSIPLRRWLIANKKKWEWLPQYYTQTRFAATG